jgi:sn-glycerol 3-phosphate transport system permease protein
MIKKSIFKNPTLPYLLVAPQLIITFLFFFWPAGKALVQAFMLSDPFGQSSQFVWFENFKFLFQSPEYFIAMRKTFLFSTATAIFSLSSGLLFAVLANRLIRFKTTVRSTLIWPYAIAPAMSGVLWLFLLHPSFGIAGYYFNEILKLNWNPVLNENHAILMVVFAASWKQISYNFVFFIGGLQAIPKSVIEAAAIDGAGPIRRFWFIVFPLLTPTLFFLFTMNLVYAVFDTFGVIHTMTQGGPGGGTTTLVYKVYADGFVGLDLGSSAAQSVILMIITMIVTTIQFKFIERKVQYT